MQTQTLGNTDLQITPLGLGTYALGGNGWQYGWGPQDEAETIATIRHALDLGLNWIDTAAAYGLGRAEELIAQALKGRSERPYLFTKCSLIWGQERLIDHSLKAESIRQEVEASLRRLQADVIDLYQIHWPVPDAEIEEGWATLARLKEEGKVRYIGASNFSVDQLRRAEAIAPISSLQPPYSLVNRQIEADILPFCAGHNIGLIVYSPMMSGLLTGAMTPERAAALPEDDWRRGDLEFQEPRLARNLALVEQLRAIGQRHGRSPGEVAIAWTLRQPAVTGAIVGGRRPAQLDEIIGAATFRLSEDELAEIETFLQE